MSGLFNTAFAQQEQQQNQSNTSNSSSPTSANTKVGSNVGTKANEQQAPAQQQQVPEQNRYNAGVTKILNQVNAPLNKTLPPSTTSTLGTEPENKNNWLMANHDLFGTRSSNQTIIGKDNVNKLQVKWIFNDQSGIEQPPLVVGDRVFVQDNKAIVLAFDSKSGFNLWKTNIGNGGGGMHGLSYDKGVIFADSGSAFQRW